MNGSVFDLDRPLEEDCNLELLKFDDSEGKGVMERRERKGKERERKREGGSDKA